MMTITFEGEAIDTWLSIIDSLSDYCVKYRGEDVKLAEPAIRYPDDGEPCIAYWKAPEGIPEGDLIFHRLVPTDKADYEVHVY